MSEENTSPEEIRQQDKRKRRTETVKKSHRKRFEETGVRAYLVTCHKDVVGNVRLFAKEQTILMLNGLNKSKSDKR